MQVFFSASGPIYYLSKPPRRQPGTKITRLFDFEFIFWPPSPLHITWGFWSDKTPQHEMKAEGGSTKPCTAGCLYRPHAPLRALRKHRGSLSSSLNGVQRHSKWLHRATFSPPPCHSTTQLKPMPQAIKQSLRARPIATHIQR